MMCLLLCFLWWATVSAWIYGKVLGFCYKPRLALTVKKDGKGTVHLLCCHTARAILPLPTSAGGARAGTEHGTRGVPDLLVTPRSAGCFPVTAQWGQSTASSLAFLSGTMTPFDAREPQLNVLLLQAAQVMSVTVTGQSHQPHSSALGHPASSSCQALPPPSRFQSLRGFNELKYLS